ncbi:MotA/TolQ/ExbB proton channel family protein [Porphyromonas sp.]|uniref:MotA/TolQ/ExbB proton channel family protein n=1 Tax=Porphyromonas sp. TaxID=1924944 RepID=UPI0026DC669B|nr:MotA/TolQ/ExbB proton channel family protein [Porphyromonas sp.]MDO4695430.1 MotA/TolQ/ExbB proton channel family protein [Porphyromonas sp.]MDO4771255.1 MotA/TolQ/ExbB proton channel family protein [Porphyromonas sp.]
MELISKILFGIANSLLIPDIILLIVLFIRAIMLAGSFYGQFITNRKNMAKLQPIIDKLKDHDTQELIDLLPRRNNAPVIPYMRDILEHGGDEDFAEYTISNFEIVVTKDLSVSRLLAKMGPVLGLVGTLIAMSPALVGLSTGDIGAMAYNMQVVFATTVVGLVISAVGLITLQYKQRWYAKDVNNLLYISRVLQQRKAN